MDNQQNQNSENQNNNLNIQPTETVMEIKPRRVWWKYVAGVVVIVIFVLGGYVAWYQYFSPEAKYRREVEKSALELPGKLAAYEAAMRADTYGGKTPEETLQLFIEALKEGDVELASKYFALKDNLTRDERWLEGLTKAKSEEKLDEIVESVSKAKPNLEDRAYDSDYKFSTNDGYGYIDMEFNKYSGVWKIESL